MANFDPLKQRLLLVLKQNLDLFSIKGLFLDYGCGSGDVSEYLVSEFGMPEGVAYDPAFDDEEIKGRSAHSAKSSLRYVNTLENVDDGIDFSVMFDVIEHVPNADEALRKVHDLVKDEGWLALTVPYNSREWGSDDEFYGHLRRLSYRGVIALLETNGWNVIRVLDPTFPTFWFIRRVYLFITRLLKRDLKAEGGDWDTDLDKSLISSKSCPWDTQGIMPRLLSMNIMPWNIVRRLDLYFESAFWGFELFLLCQKSEARGKCEVCDYGMLSYNGFFDRYSIQRCGYCGSEKILPELKSPGGIGLSEKKFPPLVEKILSFTRTMRARMIRKYTPPELSILEIRCGTGHVPAFFKKLGWRAVGTVVSSESAAIARKRGADVLLADITGIPSDAPFGMVVLFNVVEHVENLQEALSHVDKLLLPGGYLILEYPNSRSFLKRLLHWRWFGYDLPYHRLQINPVFLADRMGLKNYRLVNESHFSLEYSFYIFAQSLANCLLPFQRDSLYRFLHGKRLGVVQTISCFLSIPIFMISAPLFVVYQPIASLFHRGCIVRQVFKKTDITE